MQNQRFEGCESTRKLVSRPTFCCNYYSLQQFQKHFSFRRLFHIRAKGEAQGRHQDRCQPVSEHLLSSLKNKDHMIKNIFFFIQIYIFFEPNTPYGLFLFPPWRCVIFLLSSVYECMVINFMLRMNFILFLAAVSVYTITHLVVALSAKVKFERAFLSFI
jgi:hypothetical protein